MRIVIGTILALCVTCGAILAQTAGDSINQVDAQGLKQGYWIKKYRNGKVAYEGHFKDDRPVTLLARYYENGDIKSTFVYYDNNKACAAHIFYKDSVLMSQGLYRGEKRDSTWLFYNGGGVKVSTENYKLGVKHGTSTVFYASGTIYEQVTWKDGDKIGAWKQFFESGNKKVEGNYIDDKLDGWTRFYNVNGKGSHEGLYRNNVKDGPWNHYDDNGELDIQQRYDMGQLKNKKEVSAYIQKKSEEKK